MSMDSFKKIRFHFLLHIHFNAHVDDKNGDEVLINVQ